MTKNTAVPVIMYHSIGIPNKNWQWNYLTCPYEIFEDHLRWMKKKGFHSISLQQLYDYMKKGAPLPVNPIVLTFDDGYVDNWVFAYPLLRKYGFKGAIYVNPEFADPRNITRKNLEDVWRGETKIDELQTAGYLSWEEMKEMEDKGIMDIQSHTMSHTWYPISSKIVDFRHSRDPYIWMTWNDYQAKKPFLQIDDGEIVNYGEPIYEYGRAIGIKRYFIDEVLKEFMVDYVKEKGGDVFFRSENWRSELHKVVSKYKQENHLSERCETEGEWVQRVYDELQKSKKIIENRMNKEVKFLGWPGGAVNSKALKLASDIGYVSSTAGKDMENQKKYLRNKFGENPARINRTGSVLYWNGIEGFGGKVKYMNGFFLLLQLYNFQGRKITGPISRLILYATSIAAHVKYG
jgi:peptidoglycan/xylan/chitin deacetylase (PgdA/CDA1 family)